MKNAIGHLIGIASNLWIVLGYMIILTILILPVQEHGISFQLFVSCLISLISILWCSEYSSFVSLGKFVLRYFISFDVMVNRIVCLIFLSDLLLALSGL